MSKVLIDDFPPKSSSSDYERKMGCYQSTPKHSNSEEYIETLTLKRQVSRKSAAQNLKISISVISDPLSSDDESSTFTYHFQRSGVKKNHSFRTVSFAEGRRYTKFPNMVGYKMCLSCNEPGHDVLRTTSVVPEVEDKEICRKCSVNKRKGKKRHRTGEETLEAVSQVDIATFANLLALTALDLTAPASDAILKNRKNTWIQLAGHPGGFAPAGPNTIWKKRYTKDNNETQAYEALMEDSAHDIVPVFYREVEYNSEYFIEIEDLLQHFVDPSIMDVKMGSRTFLESEVMNAALRKDLYEKMIALDPTAPTAEERQRQSITKLRYMQFRENESSSAEFGFRIEALRMSGEPPTSNLKRVKSKEQIHGILSKFVNNKRRVQESLIQRLQDIRQHIENSPFFMSHELIGCSILVMHDKLDKCGAWIIDFSKTNLIEDGCEITHRLPWELGNHEDGFLFGLDNLMQFFSDIEIKEEKTGKVVAGQAIPDS